MALMVLLKHYVLTMTKQHPITPPPELVQQWVDTYFGGKISQSNFHLDLATQAARWGADQELKACCELLTKDWGSGHGERLRRFRRPKPPSLKEQALTALTRYTTGETILTNESVDTIRRALESIHD